MSIKLSSTNLTKNLVRRTKLIQHIDKAFATFDGPLEFEYSSKGKDDAWHPSGHCTPSVEVLYQIACAVLDGEDPDPPGITLRKTFLVGHFWHALLQHILVQEGYATPEAIERKGMKGWGTKLPFDVQREADWRPFNWATGSADVAPCAIPRHGDWLVDFKTMNSRDFSRNFAPAWAVGKWECQLNIYMDWFDLERAMIVGINKDSPHDLKEFEFVRNQELVDAIYRKWELVSICLDEDDVPHPDENIELPLKGPVVT